ncbi:MAG TPA: glycoside hydrolase family 97 protein [Cyclobacteriaceae bacterium]|nr:glycoside hydrolase family 97 protein [Cyclobacteriaceae bacterium]
MNRYLILLLLSLPFVVQGQTSKVYVLKSPDGNISIQIEAGAKLSWSVTHKGQQLIAPSTFSLQLLDGTVLGDNAKIISAPTQKVNTSFTALNYRKSSIKDEYDQLILNCKGDYGVIFRAYNDAVAYRFFTKRKGEIIIRSEEANFNFIADHKAFIPIQWDYRGGKNFNSSFEALYREAPLSKFPKDSLALLPLLIDADGNKKVVILEADLIDYPGMYLDLNQTGKGLKGVYAPFPLRAELGGYNNMNLIPTERANYIAKTNGTRSFPWRAVSISEEDKDLLNNDIVQKLATPNQLHDVSWIKPGQAAWDWWNNWNISNVDFKAGANTQTYKYYIDFASANKIPYIIMDEGWSDELDLDKLNKDIDVSQIVDYGKLKNVGVILWASWYAILNQGSKAFPYYSSMGVKGFKIDFFDRDDQVVVASTYEIARKAAEYKLLVDYHGIFKPTGLQRTFPNVIGYEGVKGLENYRWAYEDQPRYAVTIPFIRMMAGPMDYTPGAMRNSNQRNFRAIEGNPMSKGTRCNQLAMYVIYDAPLQMLSDNPTAYIKEKECTDFIVKIPVTFDETVPLNSKVGEYVTIARRKENTWFVGAMTNWTPRNLELDLSFLPKGKYKVEVLMDGVNADRNGTDYKRQIIELSSGEKVNLQLSGGGGWVARLEMIK